MLRLGFDLDDRRYPVLLVLLIWTISLFSLYNYAELLLASTIQYFSVTNLIRF